MTIQELISTPRGGCDGADACDDLCSVEDALHQALALVDPIIETEKIRLADASGRILAADVRAAVDAPRFDASAVDGYAVSVDHLIGPGPFDLAVGGRIAAGDPTDDGYPRPVAVQIFTGARVPEGLDAVIMQEDIDRSGPRITIVKRPRTGLNIRKSGEEYTSGATLLSAGAVLGPIEIACAAAAGLGCLEVWRKLKVSIVVSGNELRSPGERLEGSNIWDVNTSMLQSVLNDPRFEISDIVRVSDNRDRLANELKRLARSSDVVIVSGGASVGEEDHLRAAIKDAGGAVSFAGVAIKPGKPVMFGKIGKALLVGLPGNPVSAFVTWLVLGRPVLDHLVNGPSHPTSHHVKAGHCLGHKLGRCEYRPAKVTGCDGTGTQIINAPQASYSGRMTSLLGADGLVRLRSTVKQVQPGGLLEFIPFNCTN